MASAKVKNTTSFSRTGIITMGVPFPKSEGLRVGDTLIAAGAYTSNNSNQKIQWYPQGARWDDGSVKYARVSFKVDLTSTEEKTVSILKSNTSTPITFVRNQQLWSNFLSSTFLFSIQGVNYTIPTSSLSLIEGGQTNDHYARYKFFTHLPDAADPQIKYVWVELVAEVFSALNYIQFYFRFGFYRFYPGQITTGVAPVMLLSQPVTLNIIGPRQKIRWEEYKTVSINTVSDTNKIYTLIDPFAGGINQNKFAAGQSHAYKGVLTYETSNTASAELEEQLLGMAIDWNNTFPVSGVIPPRPSYITSDADALVRSNAILDLSSSGPKNNRGPYNWPTLSNVPDTRNTGDHGFRAYAFGMRGWPILLTTNYNWIPFLEWTTRQQATRHNWYYGTDGNPVPPNDFRNNNVRFWSGAMHSVPPAAFGGFTRAISNSSSNSLADLPFSTGSYNQIIWGPEKEHYTNTLFILQGMITMDYFSLEFAKMHSKLWCYQNRTDNYPGTQTAIDNWGVSRAVGRNSHNASFLYDFYADQEMKYWIETRLDYNYARNYVLSPERIPGGTNVVRAVNVQAPCTQPACLREHIHWRPWEEGQACFGLYFLAKVLLDEDPSHVQGTIMLRMARDSALSVLKGGFKDTRQASTSYRLFYLGPSASEAATLAILANGQMAIGLGIRGLTSNATATIYHYYKDPSNGTYGYRFIKLYAKNAVGTFIEGETIRLDTGFELRIDRITPLAGGAQSHHISPPTNGYAGYLTQQEEDSVFLGAATTSEPVGMFTYKYTNTTYTIPQSPALIIAKEAAELGLYPDSNAEILALANSYLDAINNEGYNEANSDFNESAEAFIGYIVPRSTGSNTRTVYPSPLRVYSSIPEASGTITNVQISYTFTCTNIPNKAVGRTSTVTVIATTSISVSVGAGVNHAVGFVPRYNKLNTGYLTNAAYNKAVITVNPISSIIAYSLPSQRRRFCYIFMEGANDLNGTQSIISEQAYDDPIFGPVNPGINVFHRVSVLNTINTPVTDYVLETPINPIEGLYGEAIGLNGQSFRSEGYTWYIGSESSDVWDEEILTINEPLPSVSVDFAGGDSEPIDPTPGSTLDLYTVPDNAYKSTKYTATVNGEAAGVFGYARVPHFLTRGFTDLAQVYEMSFFTYGSDDPLGTTVTITGNTPLVITSAKIYPRSLGINATITDGVVSFNVPYHTKIYIEFNDDKGNPLMIFGDPLQEAPAEGYIDYTDTTPTSVGAGEVLYFPPGLHVIGQNFVCATTSTVHIAGGAIVVGTFDMDDNATIEGHGVISGLFATPESFDHSGANFTANYNAYTLIQGYDGTGTVTTGGTVRGVTLLASPFYNINGGASYVSDVKIISPWYENTDGIGIYGDPGNRGTYGKRLSITNCFIYVGDDAMTKVATAGDGTFDGNFIIYSVASAILLGYTSCSTGVGRTTVTNTTVIPRGVIATPTWGTRPIPVASHGRSVIKLWRDETDAHSAYSRNNIFIDTLNVEGDGTHPLLTIENTPYYWGTSNAAAGDTMGITISNVTMESNPGIKSRIYGRDLQNTPHDITFTNITIGGTTVTRANWYNYFEVNEYVYNIILDRGIIIGPQGHGVPEMVLSHIISRSRKGGHITQWETTDETTGTTVNWLRRFNAGRGLGLCEAFTIKDEDGVVRTYRPTFGGAYNTQHEIERGTLHLSPLRNLVSSTLDASIGGGLLLKAGVTPLDYDVYTAGGRDKPHNGYPYHPAISRDMKQYYVLGVDAGVPGVSQLDFWSYHAQSLPPITDIINSHGMTVTAGTQETQNIIELNLVDKFRSLYLYDPSQDFIINLTTILNNREVTIEGGTINARYFGKVNTPDGIGFSSDIPSIFGSGYACAITSSPTDNNFAIGIATKLFPDSEGLTKPNVIGFRNERILNAEADIDVDSGQVLYVRSEMGTSLFPGSAYRVAGWVGLRVYIVMGTVDSVKSSIRTLYLNGTLDTLPGEDGLFSYERPAIL